MKRRNHMGFLKCYKCLGCGDYVRPNGALFSEGSSMEFSEEEYRDGTEVLGMCCFPDDSMAVEDED